MRQSPTLHKGHFCKSTKTDEKILGVWGGVTSPTILESQPDFVTSGFQRPDLTYILSNCMRHKVVAHKVRQRTIKLYSKLFISYSNQITYI